jgi:GAF domain-containing protein
MDPTVTEMPRETRVLKAVSSLVDSLLDDFDIVELLTELTEHCAQLLDVASAGLLLTNPSRHLHLMAATTEATHHLELFQLQADQGPCLDCYTTGHPISVPDLSAHSARWPRFAAAALEAGFVSVHAVPMRAAGTVLGALGLFGTTVGELNNADLFVAQTLAHTACVALLQQHPATPASVLPHLKTALTSRIVVDQAKGFLSQRLDVPVEDAFALLRRYARTHDDHLTAVARRLISEPDARPAILDAITRSAATHGDTGASHPKAPGGNGVHI